MKTDNKTTDHLLRLIKAKSQDLEDNIEGEEKIELEKERQELVKEVLDRLEWAMKGELK